MKSEWKELSLGEITELVIDYRGKTPKKLGGDWSESGYRALSAKNIKTGHIVQPDTIRFVSEEMYHKWMKDEIQQGDIIITSEAPFGQILYWDSEEKIVLSQRLFGVRVKNEYDSRFVYYYMTTPDFQGEMDGRATGTTVVGLRQPELMKCVVHCPALETQKKIATILSSIDEKISMNERINENLLVQAQTIKKQWVATNEAGYEMLPLAEVATINPDTYSPKEAWEFVNYLDTSSITDGFVADIQHIVPSSEKLPSRARRKVAAGDVLFSTVRPNQNHFGIISDPLPNMLASTGFADIRSKNPLVCNELIYLCLTEGDFIEKMQQLAEQSTSTFPSIKPSDLGTCQIPCPKDGSYNVFNDTLKTLFSLIAANFRENNSLGAMRDALLPKLMSGELDVSDIDL
jgi:type I restriction enzyme, S subunit